MTAVPTPPFSGSSEPPSGPSGTMSIRVRYRECDPMGIAHHTAYIEWFEMGRTELLRDSGRSYADFEKEGVRLAVIKIETRYRAPARYDDIVQLTTRLKRATAVKFEHEYLLRREGLILAEGQTVVASVDTNGRPCRLPDWAWVL